MSARIIEGRAVADRLRQATAEQVEQLRSEGVAVCLHAVMVGSPGAGEIYARSQASRCREVGIEYEVHALPAESTGPEIIDLIHRLNVDPKVTGILLNLSCCCSRSPFLKDAFTWWTGTKRRSAFALAALNLSG